MIALERNTEDKDHIDQRLINERLSSFFSRQSEQPKQRQAVGSEPNEEAVKNGKIEGKSHETGGDVNRHERIGIALEKKDQN